MNDTSARRVIGVDLGTSNSAVVCTDGVHASVLGITQTIAPGQIAERALLPSVVYLPGEHELPDGALRLPWGEPGWAVGEFARAQAAKVPGRAVTSAKSWLSQAGVERTAAILPWGATPDVERISPVEALARCLAHLRSAWEATGAGAPEAHPDVILTVPASFDEVARELTLDAAAMAGIERVTLLEEPLAAFYHWLEVNHSRLDEALDGVSLVLVVDVGGGTTDLTLVQVSVEGGERRLDRVAVGEHLLLGGDNIDLAVAHLAEKKLTTKLDAGQWGGLVQAAREAKEALLDPNAPETRTLTVLGASSKLLGGARKVELGRDEVQQLVLDGFFPTVGLDAKMERRVGFQEFGLRYASHPAVTMHIASFLSRHAHEGMPPVDALLFNGGTLVPALLQERLAAQLAQWFGKRPKILLNTEPNLAVAKGAAHYGRVRRGHGVRVGAGSPRAYFVGVQDENTQEPQAVCLVPRAQPEGTSVALAGRTFSLVTGQPVRFDLWSSTGHKNTRPGDIVKVGEELGFERLPPVQTIVRKGDKASEVEVSLEATVTEIGTLAVYCVADGERFKLEFQLRSGAGGQLSGEIASLPRRFDEATELIGKFYGKKPAADIDPKDVKQLQRLLERVLGERNGWTLPLLRELWSALWAGAGKRRRSAEHERQWLMLCGYALRPGFGVPLDDWRVAETFSLFVQGLQFHQDKAQWDQWWILWRRIAGGLDADAQTQIVEATRYWLEPQKQARSRPRPKGPRAEGAEEMIRLVASLERVPVPLKLEVGEWLWARLGTSQPGGSSYWTVGRLGARRPFYGSAHEVVPVDVAAEWLERLLVLDWKAARDASFAAAMIARRTGDRTRDIPEDLARRVASRLDATKAPEVWSAMVRAVVELDEAEEGRVFGDSLPMGLKLIR